MHMCVTNLTINGSDNGLSPGRRQAIIWTNAGILLIGPLGINFSEIIIKINTFPFKKIHLKMSSVKQCLFSLSLNELHWDGTGSFDMQIIEIIHHQWQESVYPTPSMPWLLKAWWWKGPGHQQPRHLPSQLGMFWFQHQKGQHFRGWLALQRRKNISPLFNSIKACGYSRMKMCHKIGFLRS